MRTSDLGRREKLKALEVRCRVVRCAYQGRVIDGFAHRLSHVNAPLMLKLPWSKGAKGKKSSRTGPH